ncbi:hypothetical protein GIB67_041410 [Kingdonia uniflora]|uniref:Ubiquitin-like protease family profile domain-containing protein n=1 Tax=Kingdonia uniflora TaxID=39325 RepID=A0A7J7LRE7_9MAGN|nr:hypothetical protein GIB67_041410 [Kingdonia uniflora]
MNGEECRETNKGHTCQMEVNNNKNHISREDERPISEPFVGLVFDSIDSACEFYKSYAIKLGFDIKIGSLTRSLTDGSIIKRRFVCRKQGTVRRFTVGCKAQVRLHLQESGKCIIDRFENNHNHDLDCDMLSTDGDYRNSKRTRRSILTSIQSSSSHSTILNSLVDTLDKSGMRSTEPMFKMKEAKFHACSTVVVENYNGEETQGGPEVEKNRVEKVKYNQKNKKVPLCREDVEIEHGVNISLRYVMGTSFLHRATTNNENYMVNAAWKLCKGGSEDKKDRVYRRYGIKDVLTLSSLESLYPRKWLDGDVISLYLRLLIRWYNDQYKDQDERDIIYVVDTYCYLSMEKAHNLWHTRLAEDDDFKNADILAKISSWKPPETLDNAFNSRTTYNPANCEYIMIPVNHHKDHWLVVLASFRERALFVLDSMRCTNYDEILDTIEFMLPKILVRGNPLLAGVFDLKNPKPWKRKVREDITQQSNNHDCGVYTLAFMDCILRKASLKFSNNGRDMRYRIARDLLTLGSDVIYNS